MNIAAFNWGRKLAAEPDVVYAEAGLRDSVSEKLDDVVERHTRFLTAYQNQAYANRYRTSVTKASQAETQVRGDGTLTMTVAKSLFGLMSYKDEYEVARLYSDGRFAKALADEFAGPFKLTFHLAPPLIARRDPKTGEPRKIRFGSWMMPGFVMLSRLKVLRGTRFDPFGCFAERRAERQMIRDYELLLDRVLGLLTPSNLESCIAILGLAREVRGYGHVKTQAMQAYAAKVANAIAQLESLADGVTGWGHLALNDPALVAKAMPRRSLPRPTTTTIATATTPAAVDKAKL